MGFFSDVLDSISGKAQRDAAAAQLQAQLHLADQQLAEQQAEYQAKHNPEIVAQREKMVMWIVFGIVVIVIAYFVFFKK